MSDTGFNAWRVHEEEDGYEGRIESLTLDDLPAGDITIKVSHSSLNFKDALSATGNKGVTRSFPHTPGIDAAGEVVDSTDPNWPVGTAVIVTGYDLGMNTAGGFGEMIRVPAKWCIPMPAGWDALKAMTYGTAGLTAALCTDKLQRSDVMPDDGAIVVTGASGGVGSVAVELLAKLGYEVHAISGKTALHDQLQRLGATRILGRGELEASKKPLQKPRWAGGVDTVGGEPLAELLKFIQPEGAVSMCGLAAGPMFPASVFPFILRGVSLLGVDSVEIPPQRKQVMWERLAGDWACPQTEDSVEVIGLNQLDDYLRRFLRGEGQGRVVLQHGL
ncbi:YhdH/YhfP family quinone oxidoreductase [Marinobacteraceae bacterium S3BR75-40.1]